MTETVNGIFKRTRKGAGLLCDPVHTFYTQNEDIYVPPQLVRDSGLVSGAAVTGNLRRNRQGPALADVVSICGLSSDEFQKRTPFEQLVPIDPTERFHLANSGEISMRIVDLVAPIGRGTRGLIVAPPKTGKTTLLEHIAKAIRADAPETRVIALLIDERPEEVTYFQRTLEAEVFASSNDQSPREHMALCELMLDHVRLELECGRDVVVLVDSLTRLVRASNLKGSQTRRTLSGGIDAGAIEIPRRLFGLARNIENGGSVTVIGTVLVGTGSRMDDLIFEEFKSTGNSEIILERSLAEARVFPAINLIASSTRKEEKLYNEDDSRRLTKLRRWLAGGKPRVAMNSLLKLMDQHPTNEELLQRIRVGKKK